MILLSVFKINFLLAFEALVLIAAIFLLLNIKKQELSKWFSYGAYLIILVITCLMICTIVNGFCCMGDDDHKGMKKKIMIEHGMGMGYHKMMMRGCGMGPGCCMEMMRPGCSMGKGSSCMKGEGMTCCKEKGEGCEMEGEEDCCKKGEGHGEHQKVIKDTVIIKKK